MAKYKINFEKAPIGLMPYGTGNDFSNVLKWGRRNPSGFDDPKNTKLKVLM